MFDDLQRFKATESVLFALKVLPTLRTFHLHTIGTNTAVKNELFFKDADIFKHNIAIIFACCVTSDDACLAILKSKINCFSEILLTFMGTKPITE